MSKAPADRPNRIMHRLGILALCIICAVAGYRLGLRQPRPASPPHPAAAAKHRPPGTPPAPTTGTPSPDITNLRSDTRQQALEGLRALKYADLWAALAITDADPTRTGYVELIYTDESRPATDHGGDPGQWNREHLWPRSRGGVTLGAGPGTDLHLIRPSDMQTNSRRGNKWYDTGGAPVPGTAARMDRDSWEPPQKIRGDLARALAYGALAYDERPDLRLVAGAPDDDLSGGFGNLDALRRWNREDPPDAGERQRDATVRELQGNTNPFVHDPGLFDRLWPSEGR